MKHESRAEILFTLKNDMILAALAQPSAAAALDKCLAVVPEPASCPTESKGAEELHA